MRRVLRWTAAVLLAGPVTYWATLGVAALHARLRDTPPR